MAPQHGRVVLTQKRRLQVEPVGKGGKAQRQAGDFERAQRPVHHRAHRAPGLHLRQAHHLRYGQHRRHRHALGLQLADGLGVVADLCQPGFDQRRDLGNVVDARGVAGVARIGGQLRDAPRAIAQLLGVALQAFDLPGLALCLALARRGSIGGAVRGEHPGAACCILSAWRRKSWRVPDRALLAFDGSFTPSMANI